MFKKRKIKTENVKTENVKTENDSSSVNLLPTMDDYQNLLFKVNRLSREIKDMKKHNSLNIEGNRTIDENDYIILFPNLVGVPNDCTIIDYDDLEGYEVKYRYLANRAQIKSVIKSGNKLSSEIDFGNGTLYQLHKFLQLFKHIDGKSIAIRITI